MPARDIFHNAVKKGLEKEGWKITHDPLSVSFELGDMYIDLGAERILAAEREGEKIAVEIKSFFKTSAISEFHTALGQFINYRLALSRSTKKNVRCHCEEERRSRSVSKRSNRKDWDCFVPLYETLRAKRSYAVGAASRREGFTQ
jgi:XisH protein